MDKIEVIQYSKDDLELSLELLLSYKKSDNLAELKRSYELVSQVRKYLGDLMKEKRESLS